MSGRGSAIRVQSRKLSLDSWGLREGIYSRSSKNLLPRQD